MKFATSEQQIQDGVNKVITSGKTVTVTNDDEYIIAMEGLKVIKKQIKQVEDFFKEDIERAHATHKGLTTKRNGFVNPLKAVYKEVSAKASNYQIAKEAEAKRIQQEEEERQRKIEEEKRLADAEALQEQGRTEEAETLISEPVNVAPPPLKTAPKVDNVATRDDWKFQIQNESMIPREFLTPDLKKIGGYVRSMKDAAKIAGVKIYVVKTPIVR